MRLTKGETNELLNKISEDNKVYGLIFKLIYIYGKEGMLVLSLKWNDIDFNNNTIKFKGHKFPLSRFVKTDLETLDHTGEYVFMGDGEDLKYNIDVFRKKLRYYMANTVKKLDVTHKVKHVALSITDLRRLRGQHLLLDGVGIDLIMDLYLQMDGTSTQFKRYLEYDELMGRLFPCVDMDDLFCGYTELNIFDFEAESDSVVNFAVSYMDFDFVVYLASEGLGFIGGVVPDSVKNKVLDLFNGGLLEGLSVLGECEYLFVDGFSFVKL